MKYAMSFALVSALVLATPALAQQSDKDAARAARKQAGSEAAKNPQQFGERMPPQGAQTRATPDEKAAARTQRKADGADAARHVKPDAQYGAPDPGAKVPSAERKAASQKRVADNSAANKAGELKGYGEAGKQ